ncbi:coiled-coil-helix-coiled-coil-helix domain-containing protein 5 isoform X5 [Bufo bufo]|uniref:coiled-coil-helix-coiled-coil-helix domain-containing protein 5 isoform X1 n=1 Tax=Bufo bufo TaxID=8384 RepID=UPI001ABE09D2|nr:coiled-coil-helix-coiled-coil-helix domain-containing protein 5 isoform X1 [Bufo bufo]XP_040270834.1 coiled-coil-helix-coiled-coil-helix domain-containing protein 5 isoform X2 [Bufo bufo]XP_040270835.1 coiled-coil-helix-coiled-coil-helix domain-containing protein 5 isoform X3 [Bufo bufo]XP_040270836.1 coiled-coil-helix-coiled-coil-helix domain-containing protein 5 isoform X4 [Bufo bufo]XP_040270837.1 coiled-coil-helix-coiled-coil-helix domain-containing protein 5 isoform X5 [Bufo bufo]
MQAALEVTAKYCRTELEEYGTCVSSKPGSWQQDCHEQKVKVAQCTSSHPIIRKIRTQCAEPFAAFEQCLKQNQAAVENCSKHVTEFLHCAESVKVSEQTQN